MMNQLKEELVQGMVWDKVTRPLNRYTYSYQKNGLIIDFSLTQTSKGWYLESLENSQVYYISSDLDSQYERSSVTPSKNKYGGASRAFRLIQELGGL